MSDSLLFLVGVVGDYDERPRQHRPALVRCMDDELLSERMRQRRCARCELRVPMSGSRHCTTCRNELQQLTAEKERYERDRTERRIEMRAAEQGYVVAKPQNRHIIERLVQAGRLHWMSATERRRRQLGDSVIAAVKGRGC